LSELFRQLSVTIAEMARRYSWALHFPPGSPELRGLSKDGREGYEYARSLARNASERRQAPLARQPVPARLTVNELAERDYTSPIAVHSKIKRARIEVFGKDLSDRAIAYRLQRRRQRPELRHRPCAHPGCSNTVPPQASAARRYCTTHRSTAARVRRHRNGNAARQKSWITL
jgi:hypothetical protein